LWEQRVDHPPPKSSEFYLRQAQRLYRVAQNATRPAVREQFLALATAYRDLAEYRSSREEKAA
jgi:hypothetical protein